MYFEQIRKPSKNMSFKRRIAITLGVILLGLLLGVLQKWLDGAGSSILPAILQQLDVGNYFGRLAIWILLGTIRVYPKFCVNSNKWRKIGRNNIFGVVALTPPLGYSINRKLRACQGQRLPGRCLFYP